MTKAELERELARVNALYAQARERVSELELNLEIARKAAPPAVRPEPTAFATYVEYVNACRTFARATRQHVVSYVSREQWAQCVNEALASA